MCAATADERAFGPRPPLDPGQARRIAHDASARAAVLVEGWSDQVAVETLARRRGCDLAAARIVVLPIGGITNLGTFIQALGPPTSSGPGQGQGQGRGLRLAGLCDLAEEPYAMRVLQRCGLGTPLNRADTEALGFFVCDADLEDELIRALGTAGAEAVLQAEGELESFRRFQAQPAQRGRDVAPQLRRFMGTRAGRKIRYGTLLTEAIDLPRIPRALDRVLAHVR
jgi:hypothetical protein